MAKTPKNEIVKLSEKPKNNKIHRFRAEYREVFSGPLPPPEVLIKYEQACKGAADRIIVMAEKQADHRRGMEAKVIGSNVQNEKFGMWLAFALTIIIMLLGTYLIMNDNPVAGFIAFFAPGLFQAGNYIYNKYSEHKYAESHKKDRVKESIDDKQIKS